MVEWTYHSNAIEGSTLTLRETKLILETGLTIGGKSLREHLEVDQSPAGHGLRGSPGARTGRR